MHLLTVSSIRSTILAHKTPTGISKKFSKHLKLTKKGKISYQGFYNSDSEHESGNRLHCSSRILAMF